MVKTPPYSGFYEEEGILVTVVKSTTGSEPDRHPLYHLLQGNQWHFYHMLDGNWLFHAMSFLILLQRKVRFKDYRLTTMPKPYT